MKLFIKIFSFVTIISLLGIMSCTEELTGPDILAEKDGPAVIDYVRITDATVSDSLIDAAFLGSLVAIIGDNLGDAKELWFNDQSALLSPPYVTDKSIIANVPTAVPTEITDMIRIVFSDESEITYPFKINVPEPIISGTKCEYVPDGGTAVLTGDFFFEPISVSFPGGGDGVITFLDKNRIEVTVPEGSEPGNIKVTTNFGTTKSPFIFRDDRNILVNYDDKIHETWTAPIGSDQVPGVSPVDGSFGYFQSADHGAWQWINEMTMQYWAPRGAGNIPVASGLVSDLVFKMEVNVPIEWKGVRLEIFFGPYLETHGRDEGDVAIARWQPWKNGPYTTDGWETLEIPLSEFKYGTEDGDDSPSSGISDLSKLTNVTMMLFGPADESAPVLLAFDNLRIVQK